MPPLSINTHTAVCTPADQLPDWLEQARDQARRAAQSMGTPATIESRAVGAEALSRFADGRPSIIQSGRTSTFDPGTERKDLASTGVTFISLNEATRAHRELVEPYLNAAPLFPQSSVEAAANLGSFEAGIFLHINSRTQSPCLRHVLVSDANLVDRSIIVCEEGSRATLLIEQRTNAAAPSRRNGYLEIHLKDGAALTLIEVQRFGRNVDQTVNTVAVIGAGARLDHVVASIGGGTSDSTNTFHVTGDSGQVTHRHATLASQNEHHTTNTTVRHHSPGGRSDISVKSTVEKGASVISHTNVHIAAEGQRTASRVIDHALILEPSGKAESIPSMEILANDVQASHSASTCQLNAEHLFYLGSRGIEGKDAKKMIVLGFLEGIVPDIGETIDLHGLIDSRFDETHDDSLARGINRDDFPILLQRINGKPLAYLDNAATAQKPMQVIQAIDRFYENDNANIHRGVHTLSERATRMHEAARKTIASFINARPGEIVFVRNTTEGINLAAAILSKSLINPGSRILITEMEHHSNIVPWQMLAKENRAILDVVEVTPDGTIDMRSLAEKLALKPAIIAITHVSNVLGTINPIKEITRMAHEQGALVLVDGAQSAPHLPIDVKDLDCDFFAFSGHKLMGPTGIGALYMKESVMKQMPPFMSGGGMIKEVSLTDTTFKDGPEKYEAGTPDIAGAVGLAAAIDYVQTIGMERIKAHNDALVSYAWDQLTRIPQITLYGPKDMTIRAGVIPFNLADIHPHDVSTILDEEGVAIRAGHHCAMPLLEKMNVPSTCRISFQFYNSTKDVDQFIDAIQKAIKVFSL